MNIVICTKKDLAGCLALNRLLTGLAEKHRVTVILSDYVLQAEKANPYAACLVAHERDMVLDHIFPLLDSLFPDGSEASCQTYSGLCARYGISMELWGPMRSPQAVDTMRALAPDIIISCRYDYIFPPEVIGMAKLGTYGLHPGALPALQGLCSPFRAMQKKDTQSGCTLFQLDAGLDTGPLVEIGWADIAYDRSLLWNFVQTYFAGIDALMRHLPILEAGKKLASHTQKTGGRQYYTYPTEEEFREFIQHGGTLVRHSDYMEMLSCFFPQGPLDSRLPELERQVTALSRGHAK